MANDTPKITNLFEALAQGQSEDISTVLGWARERFESLPLEDRYARLLNVHFVINPRVPQEKVDADLAKLAKSKDTQEKYDVLYQVLTEQADTILALEDESCAEELEILQPSIQLMTDLFKKMSQTIQKTIDNTQKTLRSMEERRRFYEAQKNASDAGTLFPPPSRSQ